jgi:hypothetical protein
MRFNPGPPDASILERQRQQEGVPMYDINCIASACVAYSCRETITGKAHTALRRM